MDNFLNVKSWLEKLMERLCVGDDAERNRADLGYLVEWAKVALKLEDMMPGRIVDGVTIVKVIVKEDAKDPKRAMLVVTGVRKKDKVVAFHSYWPGAGLFHSFQMRGHSGKLNWKLDTPWSGTSGDEGEEVLPGLPGQ